MSSPVYHCTACPAQIRPCTFSNPMNPKFVPTLCPGDGGLANWHIQCEFKEDWKGRCTEHAIPGSTYCEKHDGMKCCSCGAQATHSCDEPLQLVCGYPLCDDCVHVFMNGRHLHIKKG